MPVNDQQAYSSARVIMLVVNRHLRIWSPQYARVVLEFLIHELTTIHNQIIDYLNAQEEDQ